MKKTLSSMIAAIVVLLFSISALCFATAQEPEVAYTRSANPDERVSMYYEPSSSSHLFGEYFNGVQVTILEHVSAAWVKIRIVTNGIGDGTTGYMESRNLVIGQEGEKVTKDTIMYVADVDQLYFQASADPGPSGESGPFGRGEYIELIGIVIPWYYYEDESRQDIIRPLRADENRLHVKSGNVTGFLEDESFLSKVD